VGAMEKILVVEDSPEVSRNITDLLELNGYSVHSAENGLIGYNQAKEYLPDLIISDIMMPEVDGYEFLNLVREDNLINSTPFIFLTAKSSYDNLRDGMGNGADDYIAKPYSVNDLLNSVKNAIEKKKRADKKLEFLKNSIAMYIPHELRTPLTAILGYTECMKEELKQDEENSSMKHMLNNIHSSAVRLKEVINKFIIYSDTTMLTKDPGKLFILRKKLLPSTSETIRYAAHNLATKFSRKEDLKLNIKDTRIFIDETLFQFMITEVIENAMKYSLQGSSIEINTEFRDNDYVIKVTDSGIGIKNEYLKEFSAFTQFDRYKHEIGGSGLGIATIINILKIYNGKLHIESEENKYTSVEISIPLPKEDDSQIQLLN
jgi:two-component system, sensor histidine kinase and response regulator